MNETELKVRIDDAEFREAMKRAGDRASDWRPAAKWKSSAPRSCSRLLSFRSGRSWRPSPPRSRAEQSREQPAAEKKQRKHEKHERQH